MAGEKNFENQVKRWLETQGVYPLGVAIDKMIVQPCGYYEKRWGGGQFQKSGLPDLHITVNGLSLEVELKSSIGVPSDLQKHAIKQVNRSGGIGLILWPDGFDKFKAIVKGVISCNSHIPVLSALTTANSSTKCAMLTD